GRQTMVEGSSRRPAALAGWRNDFRWQGRGPGGCCGNRQVALDRRSQLVGETIVLIIRQSVSRASSLPRPNGVFVSTHYPLSAEMAGFVARTLSFSSSASDMNEQRAAYSKMCQAFNPSRPAGL